MGTIAALPDAALHHLFACVCDISPPTSPGICHLSLVCTRWRALAGGVTGLHVLFQRFTSEHVDSFCAWLNRHAGGVKVLALAEGTAQSVLLSCLRDAAAAAVAAGQPLPLTQLVVARSRVRSVEGYNCRETLAPLLEALPHLQHLHMELDRGAMRMRGFMTTDEQHEEEALAAIAPLHHLTSLTSLVLDTGTSYTATLAACAAWTGPAMACLTWRPCGLTTWSTWLT